jgi:nucleosome binding factor SPN SPT16 subunit
MGMEFRDSVYLLSPKNGRQLKAGMVFNVSVGLQDLVDDGGNKLRCSPLILFSLLISPYQIRAPDYRYSHDQQ